MKYETVRFPSTETGKQCGYAGSVTLKHVIFSLLIMPAFLAAGCGSSIHDAQNFSPNEAPVIENVSSSTTSGSVAAGIKKGMLFTITVTAHDPDRQKLSYDFISDYGTFGPVTLTATGCTVPFLTNGFVESGKPVSVKMSAKDTEGASAATSYNVGTGKRGPLVEVIFTKPRFIKSVNNTGIEIRSNCEGIYQIYLDNGIPSDGSGAVLRPGQDYFRYKKNPDGTFKTASAVIAGATNTDDADIKLSSVEQANRVWVVFSDGINEPVAALAETVVDDTAPGIVSIDPVNNSTGAGVNYPVRVTFNEEIDPASISNGSISVSDNNSFFPISDADGTCTSNGNIVAFTPEGYEYYSNYEVEVNSGIKDIAGNEYAGGATSVFTTVDLGTTPVPQFNLTSQTFNTAQNVSFVNIPSDVKIFYTSAVSANPSTPTTVAGSTLYTGTPITVDRNTNIKAIAIRKGYRQSAVQDLSVKIRTPKPSLSVSGTPYPTMLRVFSSDIVFTPNLNGNTLPSGEGITYYYNFVANNGIGNEILVTDPTTGSTQLTTYTFQLNPYRIKLKLIAKATNMEPSEVYESPEYRKRLLTLTAIESSIPENGYDVFNIAGRGRVACNWTSIDSSDDGKFIYATENSTGSTDMGHIWISSDYGLTWMRMNVGGNSYNWNKIITSSTGQYVAATDITTGGIGDVWFSENYGSSWNVISKSGEKAKWLISMSDYGDILSAKDGGYYSFLYSTFGSPTRSWSSGTYFAYPFCNILISSGGGASYAFVRNGSQFQFSYNNGAAWNTPSATDMSSASFLLCSSDGGNQHFVATGTWPSDSNNYVWDNQYAPRLGLSSYSRKISGAWTGLSISGNGAYIYAVENSSGGTLKGGIHRNISQLDFSGWSANLFNIDGTSVSANWSAISSSYSGADVAASIAGSDIWTSSDYGDSWTHQGLRTWTGVACSSDGKIIAACDGGAGGHGGYVYVSTNSGTTWNEHKEMGQKKWRSVDMSNDGSVIVVISEAEMWYSINNGNAWAKSNLTPVNSSYTFKKISCQGVPTSTDKLKTRIAVITQSGTIGSKKVRTLDGTEQTVGWDSPGYSYNDIIMSDDGTKFAFALTGSSPLYGGACGICVLGGQISITTTYADSSICSSISANSDFTRIIFSKTMSGPGFGFRRFIYSGGPSWTNLPTITSAYGSLGFCGNPDTGILNLITNSDIWTSIDGGTTWTAQPNGVSLGWNCIASTADGFTIFAGGTKQKNISVLK